jgi:hypothetical protein
MNKLRNLIAAGAAAVTLSFAALTPASAHWHGGFGHFHSHFHFHEHGRFGFHEHWRFHAHWRYGEHHRWCFHWRYCGPHYGWRHPYRYHVGYAAPVVAEAPACPVGFHLGYLGKHCWPNRR